MFYKSSRGLSGNITFQDVVMMGLAEDGGLIIPQEIPYLNHTTLSELSGLSYTDLAAKIIGYFADDIDAVTLKKIICASYSTFDTQDVIPVLKKGDIYIAEIFHGPTYAFKDIALQFLGNVFEYILEKKGGCLNILGATSGDTGSAAIYGVRGKKGVTICILHPDGRVSPVQEMQMTTVTDSNVFNLAVDGSFDDCQNIVKTIFNDIEFKNRFNLGAVNSINWARVLAQVVYYFHIYFSSMRNRLFENVNFVVPTGNFGNIFAGYVAKEMGLPINKLVLATNENNILSRFINNGDYSVSDVKITYSPSMDIQIASNLERYFYYLYGQDHNILKAKLKLFSESGSLTFADEEMNKIKSDFISSSTSNEETIDTMNKFYHEHQYILDPHTACGVHAALNSLDFGKIQHICLATAHPAKFGEAVEKAIGFLPEEPYGIKKLKGMDTNVEKIHNSVELVKAYLEKKLS